jgi:hypothetical protein
MAKSVPARKSACVFLQQTDLGTGSNTFSKRDILPTAIQTKGYSRRQISVPLLCLTG